MASVQEVEALEYGWYDPTETASPAESPIPEKKEAITFTEISSWQTCRMRHYYSYRALLSGEERYGSREFGHDVHGWIAQLHNQQATKQELRDEIVKYYSDRWAGADEAFETENYHRYLKYCGLALGYLNLDQVAGKFIQVEQTFQLPIHSDKGYSHRTYEVAGKIDGLIQRADGVHLYELKTAGRFGQKFIDELRISWQPRIYAWATRQMGTHLAGIIHEVISTKCNLKLKTKRGQTAEDYIYEVRQYVIDNPMKYQVFLYDNCPADPGPQDTWTESFLWSMACEIRDKHNVYKNGGYICEACDFRAECLTDSITDSPRKTTKHEELVLEV